MDDLWSGHPLQISCAATVTDEIMLHRESCVQPLLELPFLDGLLQDEVVSYMTW